MHLLSISRVAPLSRGTPMAWMTAILLALLLVTGVRAAADIPPAFTVADVPVDATADSAVAARTEALAQGEATAFHTLMQRITSAADAEKIATPNADTLTNLVADFQVADEHRSAVRYVATYTFRFNPRNVRDYLHGQGIAFTDFSSKPVVVVPVLTAGGVAHLWDDPNPWREAWGAGPGQAGLVPWVLPAGDISDVSSFDLADAANPSPDKLAALSQRYGNGDVVIANATESTSGDKAELQVTLTRYRGDGTTVTAHADISGDSANAQFYHAGVSAAVAALEAAWKSATFTAPSVDDQVVQLAVPIQSVADWGKIREKLAQVPIIHKLTIDYMSRSEMRISLKYAGDPAALKIALAQSGLAMIDGDPIGTLTARSDIDAAALPAPGPLPQQ